MWADLDQLVRSPERDERVVSGKPPVILIRFSNLPGLIKVPRDVSPLNFKLISAEGNIFSENLRKRIFLANKFER